MSSLASLQTDDCCHASEYHNDNTPWFSHSISCIKSITICWAHRTSSLRLNSSVAFCPSLLSYFWQAISWSWPALAPFWSHLNCPKTVCRVEFTYSLTSDTSYNLYQFWEQLLSHHAFEVSSLFLHHSATAHSLHWTELKADLVLWLANSLRTALTYRLTTSCLLLCCTELNSAESLLIAQSLNRLF